MSKKSPARAGDDVGSAALAADITPGVQSGIREWLRQARQKRDLRVRLRHFRLGFEETGIRIRRYTLDSRLSRTGPLRASGGTETHAGHVDDAQEGLCGDLRNGADRVWRGWMVLRKQILALSAAFSEDRWDRAREAAELDKIEDKWLKLDREIDLIQRELIGSQSARAGMLTMAWMTAAVILLGLFYAVSHGVRGFDFSGFEPWAEWGPQKYGEVACWSIFGVLCWLLYLASYYLKRRDFDACYVTWYISTALRAPFLTVALMIVILEFTEYYAAGTRFADYLLEEGNKYYFIVLFSFCLGLSSDSSSRVARELAESVTCFVRRAVGRFCRWLNSTIVDPQLPPE